MTRSRYFALAVLAALAAGGALSATVPTPERAAEYAADVPKSVVALQQFRESASAPQAGGGTVTLTSLNPNIGAWYLLSIDRPGGRGMTYHLENQAPQRRRLALDPSGLVIADGEAREICPLWFGGPGALEQAAGSAVPFAPLCGGKVYLRNRVSGKRTDLERVTELLRNNVPGGEAIIGFVRRQFYADAFLDKPGAARGGGAPAADGPPTARVGGAAAGRPVSAPNLDIALAGRPAGLLPGQWYPAAGLEGVHAGVMLPGAVAPEILSGHRDRVSALDGVESGALVYLIAFDLGRYRLGWASGTDYPGVGWSPRPPASVRPRGLPGPDGFDMVAPLVTTGMLDPVLARRTVATFAGGFKRHHGAFKYGELAQSRKGHHYGQVEQGTVLSKLQPELATLYALGDGTVGMKTWTAADDRLLPFVQSALQNGVPLIEAGLPGARVAQWGAGNWSGSAEGELRTIRAGACLLEAAGRRFLVYAHFSSATPSAMARVFQAYGCSYAMLLDMNAPVLTYAAVYLRTNGQVVVEHLVSSMTEADTVNGGKLIPRFIGAPDNRDFFYILRR